MHRYVWSLGVALVIAIVVGIGVASGSTDASHANKPIHLAWMISDFTGLDKLIGNTAAHPEQDNLAAQREMNALVGWANKTGGVGGRKIVAKSYTLDLLDTDDQELAACSRMTEDDHQQVVIDSVSFTDEAMWSCFASHHADFVGNESSTDRNFLSTVSPYVAGTQPSLDLQMADLAQGLAKIKWFKGGGKIGIALEQIPVLQYDYLRILAPALAKLNVKVDVRYFGHNDQPSAQSAALAFKSDGVNRIIFFGNIIDFLNLTGATSSQKYFPSLAVTDYQAMAYVLPSTGSAQVDANAVAVSSLFGTGGVASAPDRSSTDTSSPYKAGDITPGFAACNAILTKQLHVNYSTPGAANASGHEQTYCDNFMLWLQAARKIGPSWTPASFSAGLKALGTTYQSSVAHSTNFNEGTLGGANDYRVGVYNPDCKCFVAAGGYHNALR